jgi:hypothetical protein
VTTDLSLHSGLCFGLKSGLGSELCSSGPPVDPSILTQVSWNPVAYTTTAGSTYHWNIQDGSGDLDENITGVANNDLSSGGGTSFLYGQICMGVHWDSGSGADMDQRLCLESDYSGSVTGDRFDTTATDVLDAGDGSTGIRLYFRLGVQAPADGMLAGCWDGSTGWYVVVNSSGSIVATIDDGVTSASATVTGSHDGGMLQVAEVIIDWALAEIRLRTTLGADTTDISALSQGSVGNASPFRLLGDATTIAPSLCQVFDLYGWEGTGAASLDGTDLTTIAPWLADPNAGTKYEIDKTAGGLVDYTGVIYARGPDTGGETVLCHSGDTTKSSMTWDYRESINLIGDGGNYGLMCNKSATTDLPWSCDMSQWTTSNATVTAAGDLVDSPRGFRESHLVTADATNGYIYQAFELSTTASRRIKYNVFLRRGSAGTVTGRVIFYDVDGATERGSKTFSLSDDNWFSIHGMHSNASVTHTGTTTQMRIEIDTSGDAVHVALAGVRVDSSARMYPQYAVHSEGAAVTTASATMCAIDDAGTFLDSAKGTLKVRASRFGGVGVATPMNGKTITGGLVSVCESDIVVHNTRAIYINNFGQVRAENDDDVGASWNGTITPTKNGDIVTPFYATMEWNCDTPVFSLDHLQVSTTVGTPESVSSQTNTAGNDSDANTNLYVGNLRAGASGDVTIGSIEIWDDIDEGAGP